MMITWSFPLDGITPAPGTAERVQEREKQYLVTAVLSFTTGGIDALGLHYQASRDQVVTMPCISLI